MINGLGISLDLPLLRSIGIETAGFLVSFLFDVGTLIE